MLLEIEAISFNAATPFIFTSGWASPVYTDMRKIISYPRLRRGLIDLAAETIFAEIGYESLDIIAGGETAGIPFAAWLADRLMLPMQYIRKKPKGFGRNAQIEGTILDQGRSPARRGSRHRRPQQGQFLRGAAGGRAALRPCLRVFLL